MAKDLRITNALRSLMALAIDQEFDNGYLRIYDGSRPSGPSTAVSGQTLLAELRFAATAVASEADGVLTFAALTADASANATGTATWCRALKADGTTALADGTVATSDANLVLNTVSIVSGANVSVSSCSFTVAASSAL